MSTLGRCCSLILIFGWGLQAHAATCTAGEAGKKRYASSIYEYCDGTNWVSMKGASLGSCTAGEAGKQRYSSSQMQFCDGTNWYSMKGSSVAACTAGDTGKQRYTSSQMQFCDGSNWYKMAPVTLHPDLSDDSNYSYAVLLLPLNSSSGSLNLTDYSSSPKTLTNSSNVVTWQTSEQKFYGGAAYFPGTSGQQLITNVSTDLDLNSSDFTIEYWFKRASAKNYTSALQMSNGADLYSMLLGYDFDSTDVPYFWMSSNGSSWALPNIQGDAFDSNWRHYAISRSGTTVKTFQNGVEKFSGTFSGDVYQATNQVSIGMSSGGYLFNGYLQDLRVYKGISKYNSAFTPPGKMLNVTKTVVVKVWGAGGGGDNAGQGGAGGFTTATYTMESGTQLYVWVGTGGAGSPRIGASGAGGSPGGGSTGAGGGGGGGGYSGVFSANSLSQTNAIVIAGGGGGESNHTGSGPGGAGGGTNGQAAGGYTGGQGGTQSAGGASTSGSTGGALQGATGTNTSGGGGGWYGGGGGGDHGANHSAGGGGSGYIRTTSLPSGVSYVSGSLYTGSYGTPATEATSDSDYPGSSVAYGGGNPGYRGHVSIIVDGTKTDFSSASGTLFTVP